MATISVFSRGVRRSGNLDLEALAKDSLIVPCNGVAITSDNNYILIADRDNHRIQMFTMEGEFARSVGEKGTGPLQFDRPAGYCSPSLWSSVHF